MLDVRVNARKKLFRNTGVYMKKSVAIEPVYILYVQQ